MPSDGSSPKLPALLGVKILAGADSHVGVARIRQPSYGQVPLEVPQPKQSEAIISAFVLLFDQSIISANAVIGCQPSSGPWVPFVLSLMLEKRPCCCRAGVLSGCESVCGRYRPGSASGVVEDLGLLQLPRRVFQIFILVLRYLHSDSLVKGKRRCTPLVWLVPAPANQGKSVSEEAGAQSQKIPPFFFSFLSGEAEGAGLVQPGEKPSKTENKTTRKTGIHHILPAGCFCWWCCCALQVFSQRRLNDAPESCWSPLRTKPLSVDGVGPESSSLDPGWRRRKEAKEPAFAHTVWINGKKKGTEPLGAAPGVPAPGSAAARQGQGWGTDPDLCPAPKSHLR